MGRHGPFLWRNASPVKTKSKQAVGYCHGMEFCGSWESKTGLRDQERPTWGSVTVDWSKMRESNASGQRKEHAHWLGDGMEGVWRSGAHVAPVWEVEEVTQAKAGEVSRTCSWRGQKAWLKIPSQAQWKPFKGVRRMTRWDLCLPKVILAVLWENRKKCPATMDRGVNVTVSEEDQDSSLAFSWDKGHFSDKK